MPNPFDQFDQGGAPQGAQPIFTVPPKAPDPLDVARNAREQRTSDLQAQEAQLRLDKARREADAAPPALPDMNAPTGDAYLKTLPVARASQVRALAEGRMALPSGAAMRSPTGASLLADVAQYDPTFDVANANSRIAARKAFTSGKQGQNIIAFNTAIGHLGTLAQAVEGLNNTGAVPLLSTTVNSIKNAVASGSGDPSVTNFDTARKAVVDELTRAFRGTGGNVSDIAEWEKTLNSSRSPAQLRGAIRQAAELLQSRISAIQDSYNASMGTTNQPLPMLNQHAADALNAFKADDYLTHGYSASHGIEGSGPDAGAPPSGGTPPPTPSGAPPDGGGEAIAQGDTRLVRDPKVAALIDSMIRAGATADEINAKFDTKTYGPVNQTDVAAAQNYLRKNPGDKRGFAVATRYENQTLLNKVAASPVGAGAVALANQGLFGTLPKIVAGAEAITGRIGGDQRPVGAIYQDALDTANSKVEADAQTHPLATLAGDVGGYLVGERAVAGVGGALLRRIPGTLSLLPAKAAGVLAKGKPAALDAAVGGLTGAGSSDSLADVPGNAVSGALLAAGGGVLGRGAAKAVGAVVSPVVGGAVRRLTDAGVTLTPGQIAGASGSLPGRMVKGIEDRIAGIPVVGDVINSTRRSGVEDFNRVATNDALAPIGVTLPEDVPVGHEAIQYAQKAVSDAYDKALAPMRVTADVQFGAELDAITRRVDNMSKAQNEAYWGVLKNDIEPFIPAQGPLEGKSLQAIKQGLDKRIAEYAGPNAAPADKAVGERLTELRTALLSLAGRADPANAAEFAKANEAYSYLSRVEGAAEKSKDGVFTPNQFRQAVVKKGYGTSRKSNAAGTSRMQQLATDASTVLPNTVPDSGTAGRAALALVGKSLGTGAPGALLGGTAGYQQGGGAGALTGATIGALALSRPGSRAFQAVVAGSRGAKLNTLGALIRANPEILGVPSSSALLTYDGN